MTVNEWVEEARDNCRNPERVVELADQIPEEMSEQFGGQLYIPENPFDIEEGYFNREELKDTLLSVKSEPAKVYFIADMLEE